MLEALAGLPLICKTCRQPLRVPTIAEAAATAPPRADGAPAATLSPARPPVAEPLRTPTPSSPATAANRHPLLALEADGPPYPDTTSS